MIDKILKEVLILDGNETCNLDNNTYLHFQMMIVELAKIKYNIRYCNNEKCPCHPESEIQEVLINNEKLAEFLKQEKLYNNILKLTDNYIVTTIFDNKEECNNE